MKLLCPDFAEAIAFALLISCSDAAEKLVSKVATLPGTLQESWVDHQQFIIHIFYDERRRVLRRWLET